MKFVQKGYTEESLNKIIQEVSEIPRELCLKKKPEVQMPNSQHQLGFISNFHCQYKEIENIYKKHWHILCRDRHLGELLRNQPKFIYRGVPNLGDRIVKKILDPPDQQALKINLKGFFAYVYVAEMFSNGVELKFLTETANPLTLRSSSPATPHMLYT